jgi:hypothetical protein
MQYEKPKLIKGVTPLPALTAAFAQPATITCKVVAPKQPKKVTE